MAARNKPGKAGKPPKGGRGKMPVKRSINLVLVDENKIRSEEHTSELQSRI